jgi:hypothetical protein
MPADRGSLPTRLQEHLQSVAARGETITYQSLAKLLGLKPPNTIQQLATALEALMSEDAQAQRPFIAALVISKRPPHLPGLGFFQCAAQLGRFSGDDSAHADFHASELHRVYSQWKDRG